MKLAISNIAWDPSEDIDIRDLLKDMGVNAIEVAPTKINSSPLSCSIQELDDYRAFWMAKGISIVAMQSLLFGRPDLVLFGDKESRSELYHYLTKILELGARLGVKSFVFGSPKNRLKNTLNIREAYDISIPFFVRLGQYAEALNVQICIEPNPTQYGCDFIRNTEEGIAFVKAVGHRGVGLHLDAAALALNKEDIFQAIASSSPYLSHFHVSEPFLSEVNAGIVDHQNICAMLKEIRYEGYISIEMKDGLLESNLETVQKSLNFVKEIYLGSEGGTNGKD